MADMKIGLALGSGASRGWSHIGVIKALVKQGIEPDIVCGTSIGSLVGASYVSGHLDDLEQWALSLSKLNTVKFFEINRSFNGFVNKDRLHHFLSQYVASDKALIEEFDKDYASVATDLKTGREIWLSEGSVLEAVWASISLPGLFPAIQHDNKWLVDGGLVNPVPVSTCRALGADVVIAVNLNGDIVGKHIGKQEKTIKPSGKVVDKLTNLVAEYTDSIFSFDRNQEQTPSLFEAIAGSVNITQDRITRSRMAGDPPDIILTPKLSQMGLLEFYRAQEAIDEGMDCVERMMQEIQCTVGK
ncbi:MULTISPECIES: patatin-like phospholipase RssA [Cycloclasticus]|uniref:patatin-like phospholipase RssA n=1 Tax=Cycloclasticus TaxID=34067 RepID=UPI000921D101|nr:MULTISPECIES: patatin-like phospholipase RssA [Cycloclasticus]PHR52162.1 MAG: patatin [Cycloclasticus sp.]SHJ31085.1 NTE family protein [Cycloclasticus pugetii]